MILPRIFLTRAISVASRERSFSKLKLIKNYLRSAFRQGLIGDIEAAQKTWLIIGGSHQIYEEILKFLKLPSLVHRRRREDLIKLYNRTYGSVQGAACPAIMFCPNTRTRGHELKLSTTLAMDYSQFFSIIWWCIAWKPYRLGIPLYREGTCRWTEFSNCYKKNLAERKAWKVCL